MMRFIKIFAVSALTTVYALSSIAQNEEQTDSTMSSSESLTKLDTAQASNDESAVSDATSETIDGLVDSMVDAAVSMFGLTLSGDLFDEAIADLEKNWVSSIKKFDTDKDGSLSLDELKSVPEEEWADDFKALSDEEREETLQSQFTELDTDEDGEVSSEEVVKHVEKHMKTLEEVLKSLEMSPSTESDVDASDTVE